MFEPYGLHYNKLSTNSVTRDLHVNNPSSSSTPEDQSKAYFLNAGLRKKNTQRDGHCPKRLTALTSNCV